MLRAGDHVDAHVVWNAQIVSFAVGVRETAALLPVLRRSLRVENQRIGSRPFKNSIAPARLSIFDDVVSVRKKLGIELIGVLLRRGNRAGELVVQIQAAAARDMGRDGVENFSVRFVLVEAVIDEVSKITPALRTSPSVSVIDAGRLLA